MSDVIARACRKLAARTRKSADLIGSLNGEVTFKRYGIELRPNQKEILDLLQQAMESDAGGMYTIKSARQTGKNEIAALNHHRFLERYGFAGKESETIVRMAPTYIPQIVNSKARLEKFLRRRILPHWDKKDGFRYIAGNAEVMFLSARASASVEGATATKLLDIDEAHRIDETTFEESIVPFTADRNAATVLWGVGGYSMDVLHKYYAINESNGESWRNLTLPAKLWAQHSERYAAHYADRIATLGIEHPVIKTQYDLEDLDAAGKFFKERQIRNMFSSEHNRYDFNDKHSMLFTVDIAGEQENEVVDPGLKATATRDSTVVIICHVDFSDMVHGLPKVYINNILWWVGKAYAESNGVEGQQESIVSAALEVSPFEVLVDARGIGNQVAKFVNANYGCMEYNATAKSCTEDVFATLAYLNNDRFKMWQPDSSAEHAELLQQMRHCDYKVSASGNMNLQKPKGAGHIDFIKALSYIPRVIEQSFGVGAMTAGSDPT